MGPERMINLLLSGIAMACVANIVYQLLTSRNIINIIVSLLVGTITMYSFIKRLRS